MASSRFHAGLLLRVAGLFVTLQALGWAAFHTHWYVTMGLIAAAAAAQVSMLSHFATRSGREVARFLDGIAFNDNAMSFQGLSRDSAFADLGAAMGRVLDQLRAGQSQREEQAQYLQALIEHVPVALIAVEDQGRLQLLNLAARRLFEQACPTTAEFTRYGQAFAATLESLRPGHSAIVRMERRSGPLQLKAAATDFAMGGVRKRLFSLQNIEIELSAQELAAWQTVIRVMEHEVMNSLTPVSSLAATARDLVDDVLGQLPADSPHTPALKDASEALEVMAQRSQGLLHFVQNHRRLTKRLVSRIETVPLQRTVARLQRLLADELAMRNIQFKGSVQPETLELAADPELLDQALINLIRNGLDALGETHHAQIGLSAYRDAFGHVVIAVADNGPGIAPEQREKVFVPFFTTKRQGSGVGLTLVRQIATLHGATVGVSDTAGGGATITLRF